MIERTKTRAERTRELLKSLPKDAGVFPADELLGRDKRGNMLLPFERDEPREIPARSATAEGW